MEALYSIELQDVLSLVFLVKSPLPSVNYKIKIDISKSANKNTQVFVLDNLSWSLLLEDSYKEQNQIGLQNHNNQRQQKINEIMGNIYKLLCQ